MTRVRSVLHLELVILYYGIRKSHYVSPWRVTLFSQPCFHVIFFERFLLSGPPQEPFNTFSPHTSPPSYIFGKSNTIVCIFCMFFFFSPQQAITAICAPGEMIALWIKFGGKTALHVASESAIKQE